MKKVKVVAAVPAYNAAKTLPTLLDELIKQRYNEIFVLDDASTDSTVKIAKSYGSKVQLIESDQNVGSGANRNRIIGRTKGSIIHFIDADMKLLSKNTPGLVRAINWPDNVAFIGGMVRNPDGTQNPFNYGPRPHFFVSFFVGSLQFIVWLIGSKNVAIGSFLRKVFDPVLHNFPKIYENPRERRVYWTAESNMLIQSDLFERHGGYDPRFRYSEMEDFALRIYRSGQHGKFEPNIDAMHATNDNVLKSGKKRLQARKQFHEKYGRLVSFVPPLADYFDGRKTQKRYHK